MRALLQHTVPRGLQEQVGDPQPPSSPQQGLWEDWGSGGGDMEEPAQQQHPQLQLSSHDVAPLLWVSCDEKEAVFVRPFAPQQRYERQAKLFGFVGFRFVGFNGGVTALVSYCKAPEGRCPDSTRLESIFSGKDYSLSTLEDVVEGGRIMCSCAQELLAALGGEPQLRALLSARNGNNRTAAPEGPDGSSAEGSSGVAAVQEHISVGELGRRP